MSDRTTHAAWTSWQLLRHFGPRWAAYRVKYAVERKSGWRARRENISDWEAAPLASLVADSEFANEDRLASLLLEGKPRFFFTPEFVSSARDQFLAFDDHDNSPIHSAQHVAEGQFSLFHVQRRQLKLPPDWHTNAITEEQAPADVHWSRVDDFAHGDIKVIWDLNRFHFAFDLARAYARSGDEQWPALFWQLVEDWRANNRPNLGVNWKCGQEASFRAMAWCFALFAMGQSKHATASRVANLVQMLALTARRIASNIDYAVSQKNNHGISEAVGLLTIGLLLPELRGAAQWRRTGRQVLSQLARELIYDDGGFSQHSWNYHRLMLHDFIWAIRLSEIHGQPLESDVVDRVRRAGELLYQVMDVKSGGVPCYGQDDGSLILPLNNCSYFDYRPVVQMTSMVASGNRVFSAGPWDEDVLWLLGSNDRDATINTPKQRTFTAPDSGYTVLRSEQGFAFTRAANFRHRPAQADMLHVDVWWQGQTIAIDPGTYSYNAPPPWNNPLATAQYHNTVTVDGLDQMTRTGRFVWLPWLKSKSAGPNTSSDGQVVYWQGEHNGYQRLPSPVRHRRAVVQLPEEHWLVLDRLESSQSHRYRLHWLLADWPYESGKDNTSLMLKTPAGEYRVTIGTNGNECTTSRTRADDLSPRGWRAHGYQRREPATSWDAIVDTDACWFWTLLGPGEVNVSLSPASIALESTTWQRVFPLGNDDASALINHG